MRTGTGRSFIKDTRGGVAVEFVALLPAFLFLTFFVFEIGVAMFLIGSVEKAAQLGARLAVVSDVAVSALDQKNGVMPGFVPGDACGAGACTAFEEKTCNGGDGCAAGFSAVVSRMANIARIIRAENVTITYAYVGLGFAGGPIVPRVTVTVQNVPYDTFATTIMAGFMRLATGDRTAQSLLTTLPTIEVTFTGEDLTSSGAS